MSAGPFLRGRTEVTVIDELIALVDNLAKIAENLERAA